jgi:hypothetical protein
MRSTSPRRFFLARLHQHAHAVSYSATKDFDGVRADRPDVVYICDWLPPDFGAVGQYSLHFSRERVRAGSSVALYGLSSKQPSVDFERHHDAFLKVVRLKVRPYDKSSLAKRALWTARTNARLLWHAFGDIIHSKEVVFTGSPPFLLHLLAPLNVLFRRQLIYRITDFFPECLMAELGRTPAGLALLYRLTVFWRRRVSQFEVLGEDQRRRLVEIGIDESRIVLRRDPSPVSVPPSTRPLPRPPSLSGKRILLYSGNFGVAHDHETFLAAYERHHRHGNAGVALWLNATGARANALNAALIERGLPVFRTEPVPLDQLASLLVTADAHLITLRDAFAGFVLPSKVYGCIESGKDILFIGPRASDVHLLCDQSRQQAQYFHSNVGDVDGVYAALEKLGAADSNRRA